MARGKYTWAICLVLLFLSEGVVSAQVTVGIISGVVQDSSGAVLPHAKVTVRQTDTALNRSTETDDEGRYRIPELPLGDYEVEASLSGFATETQKGVTLTVGREAVVNVTLRVGVAAQSVSVTAEAPLLDTTNASVAYLVDDQKIRELPLNGRDYTQLALLQPGVADEGFVRQDASTGTGIAMSISGAQTNQNVFLLDGQSINDASGITPGSAAGTNLGIDAIQEFNVITTDYSPEFGINLGGVINVVTRSGTNDFHGSAFEFLRNSFLDAKNFFDLPSPAPIPAFKRNQFGGSLGGRIIKNKTFFFSAYEGLRQRQADTLVAAVPDALAHAGYLPNAAGVETYVGVNPDMVSRLNSIPLPNGVDNGDGTGKLTTAPILPGREDYLLERVDHRFSNNDTIFARYVFDRSTADAQVENLPITRSHDLTQNQYLSLNWTKIISPNVVNVARAGVNRSDNVKQGVNLTGIPDSQLSILEGQNLAADWSIQSPFLTDGQIGLGGYGESPRHFGLTVFELADDVSYSRGGHSFKFGILAQRYNLNDEITLRPSLIFQSVQQFLQGQVYQYRNFLGNPVNNWQQYLLGWFAQDDIRLSRRLTINLGIRHEFTTNPNDVNGHSADLRNFSDATVTVGPLFATPKDAFQPRAGLAWDVFGTGKTAVRAGAGIYNEQLTPSVNHYALFGDYPFAEQFSIFNPTTFVLNPASLPPLGFAPLAFQYNAKLPTRYQWSLDVQQQIAEGTTLSVAYVGSRSVHLETRLDVNPYIPEILPNGTKYFPASGLQRRNPAWGDFNGFEWDGMGYYQSLQVNVLRRLSKGLQFQGAYTWSKDIDLVSNTFGGSVTLNGNTGVKDPENLAGERGLSSNDMRHLLSANITYDLPFGASAKGVAKEIVGGWQVGGLLLFHTGLPFDIQDGFEESRDGQGAGDDRPNVTPGASNNPTSGVTAGCAGVAGGQKLGTPTLYFDPCAFQLQPAGTYGNLSRNTVIGPPEANLDMNIMKMFPIKERTNLQFRAEAFNIFNHPNLGNFVRTLFEPSGARVGDAGQFTNTLTPSRQIQFALKLTF
jgi:hypothetical protein